MAKLIKTAEHPDLKNLMKYNEKINKAIQSIRLNFPIIEEVTQYIDGYDLEDTDTTNATSLLNDVVQSTDELNRELQGLLNVISNSFYN